MKTKKSYRQKIRKAILKYFSALRKGQKFHGFELSDYCLRKAGCPNKYKATVLQYMNQMKNEDPPLLNYECLHKEKSLYRKLSIDKI